MAYLDLEWVARMNKRPRDETVPVVHSHQWHRTLVPAHVCWENFNPQDPDRCSILKYKHQQEWLIALQDLAAWDSMKPYMQHLATIQHRQWEDDHDDENDNW